MLTLSDPPTNRQRTNVDLQIRESFIPVDGVTLRGELRLPGTSRGVVVFAHGSGSSRRSPRNRFVAQALSRAGFATLLIDLLDEFEEHDRDNVFDVEMLAERLTQATDWVRSQPGMSLRPVGYFGASTGSAAALVAAANDPDRIAAVVSRGGRPDLAGTHLAAVCAPTLLIVGGADPMVCDLNRKAAAQMTAETELVVVPLASHLFTEPGALWTVARMAAHWFGRHFALAEGLTPPDFLELAMADGETVRWDGD